MYEMPGITRVVPGAVTGGFAAQRKQEWGVSVGGQDAGGWGRWGSRGVAAVCQALSGHWGNSSEQNGQKSWPPGSFFLVRRKKQESCIVPRMHIFTGGKVQEHQGCTFK